MDVQYGSAGDFIFREAVEFLKKRKAVPKEEYLKLDGESRAKAFTVSGYTKAEIIGKFLETLTEAVESGKTREQFREEMGGFLSVNGYEGLNPFRADVIFRTNIQTAYNAGHYRSMTDPAALKLRPYWQYRTAADGHVRDEHAMMHGRVYRADDPVWDTWYPPNGFRCRCSVASLSARQVKERGLEVETGPPREVDTRTGEIKEIRPDKGFAVNPARHAWEPDMEALSGAVRGVFEKEMHKTPSTLKNSARQGIVAEKKNRCVITRYNAIVGGMGGGRSVEDRVVYVLDGMDASEAPDEIKLLPLGKVHSQKGDFLVDDESYELINRQFKERGLDLVIDYEHQTLKDVQAPAGGWIKELIKQEDAIAAKVEWTPRAKEYLRNKEYKYLSPVVICRKSDGKAVALHSAALTNTPAIDRMFALVNSIDIDLEGDVDMEEGGTRMELKKIIELLGLPEGATEEDVVKALSAARKAAEGETVANKTILGLLELKEDARTEDVAAKIMALKGTEEKSKDEMVMELKRRLDEKDADGLVMNALKQGKISAAQKEWAKEYALKDPKGFEAFVAKAPTVVPVKKIATGGEEKTGRHTDLDARILKNLGISVDDLEVKE